MGKKENVQSFLNMSKEAGIGEFLTWDVLKRVPEEVKKMIQEKIEGFGNFGRNVSDIAEKGSEAMSGANERIKELGETGEKFDETAEDLSDLMAKLKNVSPLALAGAGMVPGAMVGGLGGYTMGSLLGDKPGLWASGSALGGSLLGAILANKMAESGGSKQASEDKEGNDKDEDIDDILARLEEDPELLEQILAMSGMGHDRGMMGAPYPGRGLALGRGTGPVSGLGLGPAAQGLRF